MNTAPAPARSQYLVAPDELREQVARIVAAHGIAGAARVLGIGREAIARVCAGVPTRPGTLALIRERIR